ncbi:MAG: hypothetical protein ACHQ50_15055, partial [Fimbriimonadales bacterium]
FYLYLPIHCCCFSFAVFVSPSGVGGVVGGAALGAPHDSEFALFAGGTMTVLLIGMTMGSGSIEKTEPAHPCVTTEPELAA